MSSTLDADALDAIIKKAIGTDLIEPERRRLLLARIPPGVRASLPRSARPDDQLRSDVLKLNELGLLEIWLNEAKKLSHVFGPAGAAGPTHMAKGAAPPDAPRPVAGVAPVAAENWSALIVDEANTKLRGSGVVIGPRHVLTARHVVSGSDCCCVRRTFDGAAHRAKVEWRSTDLDVALLVTDDTIDGEASIAARTREGSIAGDVYWEAFGYPAMYAKTPNEDLQQESGRTHAWSVGSVLPLALTIQAGPKGERALNGLSGAGVLIDGRVVAIITAFEKARQQERIDAIPLARFFGAADFRKAVGLPMFSDAAEQARQRREAAQAALASRLRDIVDRSEWLRAHFIRLHRPGDAVDQICNLPGDQVASWLYRLADDHPTQLGTVREIACLIMPILTDWTRLQAMLTRQLVDEDRFLRLPVVDLSVCEMIMAGLDGRSAAFVRQQQTCVGILADASLARVHRPALFSAPLLPTREAQHMPQMVAQAIVDAAGRPRRGDVFRQARGILLATRLAYQSYLVVDEACAKAAIDAVLDEKRLPGLRVAQAFEDPEYEVLSSALETVLEMLFPQDETQDAHGN